jgi:hypothetical protein
MVLSCLRLWMNRTLRPAAAKELRNLRRRRVLVNGSVQDFQHKASRSEKGKPA